MDLSRLDTMDSACVAIVVHLQRQFEKRSLKLEVRGANPELKRLLALHVRKRRRKRTDRRPRGLLSQLGQATVGLWARGVLLVASVSDGSAMGVIARAGCDIGAVGYQMTLLVERAGSLLTPALVAELRQEVLRS